MDCVVLITGAASGIGLGITKYLLSVGAKVLMTDINETLGNSERLTLAKEFGETSIYFCVDDVTNEDDAIKTINMCVEKFGKIDVLVNNAGIGLFESTYDAVQDKVHDLKRFTNVLNVNTIGTFNMSRFAAQAMSKNKPGKDDDRGVIINISSTSGIESTAGQLAYATSKAAINGMTLIMARDLAPIGIRVMTVCPGAFETPALKKFIDKNPNYKIPSLFPERIGTVEELGQVIKLIIECKIVNGTFWRVDGGGRV